MHPSSGAICALITVSIANAGDLRLRIEPAQPHPGQTVTVTFDPKGGPLEKFDSLVLVYGYTPSQWSRLPMVRKDGRFTADVPTFPGINYLWFWVEDKESTQKDTNRGTAWDTYLYDDKGLPEKGAREMRAALYQLRGQPIDKNTASLNLLEEELRAFPANAYARGAWWRLRYEDAEKTVEARDRILKEIAVFLDSNLDKPWAYLAAAQGYQALGRTDQAVQAMRDFVKRFPEDDSLDGSIEVYFGAIGGTPADLESLQRVSIRWAASAQYWQYLFRAYERSHSDAKKLQHAGEQWLALVPKNNDAFGHIRVDVAEGWLANGVDPAAAERIAREAASIAESGSRFSENSSPDRLLNPRTMRTPMNRSTLGWALFQQGRYEDALLELERAVAIGEKEKIVMHDVYYRLGQTLERLDRPADALNAYCKELAWGQDDGLPWKAAAAIYAKDHGGMQGFETELRSRVNELAAQATTADPVQITNEKLGRFDLRGLEGQLLSLTRYEGKLVLIDYWSTWCGPCLTSLENTQKLVREFPGKVVVLAVSTDGEETRSRAQPYLAEKGYDFTLLFDDEHKRDLEVPFVPSRFLLDRKGRLRVREFGASVSSDVVFEQKLRALVTEAQP